MEELLSRLELTVKDFNQEMKNLCNNLVTKEKERQQLLEMLKSTNGNNPPISAQSDGHVITSSAPESLTQSMEDEEDIDIPEWEKKLKKIEKK